MTREEAKKLVNPLKWVYNTETGQNTAIVEMLGQSLWFRILDSAYIDGAEQCWVTLCGELITSFEGAAGEELKPVAERLYQEMVLGFLNLEGGEE